MACTETYLLVNRRDRSYLRIDRNPEYKSFLRIAESGSFIAAPISPQNFTTLATRATEVDLDWDDIVAPYTFDDYKVYVKNTDTNTIEQEIAGIQLSETTVMGLTTYQQYEFWVVSVRDGVESAESNIVSAIPSVVPSAPTGLAVTQKSSTTLTLDWDDAVDTITGYDVLLNGVKQNTNPISVSQYEFTELSSLTQYTLGVKAVNNTAESQVSSTTTKTTIKDQPFLFVDAQDGNLTVLNKDTGQLIDNSQSLPVYATSRFLIDPKNSWLYFCGNHGRLWKFAIANDGTLTKLWGLRPQSYAWQHATVDTDGNVFLVGSSNLWRIDQSDGSTMWKSTSGAYTWVEYSATEGVVAGNSNNAYWINIADGSVTDTWNWSYRGGSNFSMDSNGYLHYQAPSYGLYMLDLTNRTLVRNRGLIYWIYDNQEVVAGNGYLVTNNDANEQLEVIRISDYAIIGGKRSSRSSNKNNKRLDIDVNDNIYYQRYSTGYIASEDLAGNTRWTFDTGTSYISTIQAWPGKASPWM